MWVDVSQADYLFLTAQRDSVAAKAYEQVLSRIPSFNGSAVRDQMELLASLNVGTERVKTCLQRFPLMKTAPTLRQAIVFTGHMIDEPGREKPRFPLEAEGMIREEVNRLRRLYPGNALGGPRRIIQPERRK
jgi:hypothetical protein